MILFSDLHDRAESHAVCSQVLDNVFQIAQQHREAIACLGDLLHFRYHVPVFVLNDLRERFHAWGKVTPVFILPGNHDQIDVGGRNALECFADIPGVTVFNEPTQDSRTGVWIPYRKDTVWLADWIGHVFGGPNVGPVAHLHQGVVGAQMNNGREAGPADGLRLEDLPFQTVYCGHWHRHQRVGQCVYVGSQWQTKMDEAGQVKGVIHAFPEQGMLTGPRWEFIPLDVGARHHRVEKFTKEEIANIRPGDKVRVPAGINKKTVELLFAKMGAEVFQDMEAPVSQAPRLGLPAEAPLRAQAEKYVSIQQLPEGFTAQELLALYDEISGGA